MTDTGDQRVAFRTCPLCEATCGLEITLEGDRVKRIRGDRDDVFSHGFICPKGSTLKQLHEDPDWLRAPVVKDGDGWREVTWDEAFAAVEEGLTRVWDAHGRNAVALYLGNPSVHHMSGALYLRPLIQSMGTRNLCSASTVDQMPKHVSSGLLFGDPGAMPVPDLDRTDFLLMLGANPWESNGSLCTAPDFPGRVKAIQARGGRVVVVDPRRTRSAEEADEHVAIRPGGDAHLLLAMVHVVLEEGLGDAGVAGTHTDDLEDLPAAVAPFTPEAVAAVTGLEANDISRLAREFAGAATAVAYGRIGTHTVSFGTLAAWAVDALNLVTGNLDRPGGAMFPLAAHSRRRGSEGGGRGFRTGRWNSRVREFPEVRGEIPVASLADEMTTPGEDQVRALVTVAGNPVLSTPDGGRLDAAIADLDFHVAVDPYINETSRHADVILPPPSALTRGHYDLAFYGLAVRNVANYSPPTLPDPDAVPEHEILARLALIAAGQGAAADPAVVDDLLFDGLLSSLQAAPGSPIADRDPDEIRTAVTHHAPEERLLDLMLRAGPYGDGFGTDPDGLSLARLQDHPHGIDLGALEPRLPGVLKTRSGRVELLSDPIRADLDRLAASLEVPANGTMVLIGRRHVRSNNSWMHNVDVLVKGKERCTLQVHPADAERLGLADGASARVTSRVGTLDAPVEVTDTIRPGVVSLPHGWGHDLPGVEMSVAGKRPGVNVNLLTDGAELDPLSGNAVLNGVPVEIAPS
jgi:anaerobic selenocysteine-containing dehydrogenase